MAMIVATLQADFLATFLAMNNMMNGGGNAYCAEKIAQAIKKYILTGVTNTTDTGAAPAGPYTGTGVGTMAINDASLKSALQNTFEAKYNDNDLAAHMATDIDNACKADNTVSETSTGQVTPPSSSPITFSGPATGKFAGSKLNIENPLKSCFSSMANMMTGGGNELYAQQFASAVDIYLKTGSISVQLKVPPFASGSGSGKIA